MHNVTSYKELLQQRAELDQHIETIRRREVQGAIEQARALAAEFGLSQDDVFGKRRSDVGSKVAAKYRDPQSGATWSGRGRAPKWIDDKDRQAFAIT